jgi:hypothetical protein
VTDYYEEEARADFNEAWARIDPEALMPEQQPDVKLALGRVAYVWRYWLRLGTLRAFLQRKQLAKSHISWRPPPRRLFIHAMRRAQREGWKEIKP